MSDDVKEPDDCKLQYAAEARAPSPKEIIEQLKWDVHRARREVDKARDYLRAWDKLHADLAHAEAKLLSAVLAEK